MKGDREWFLAAGFDGYLEKPISVRELPEQVQGLLQQTRPRSEAGGTVRPPPVTSLMGLESPACVATSVPPQLRATRDRRRGARGRAPVRAQDQRHGEAVEGERGCVRPRRRRGRPHLASPAGRARHDVSAARSRDGSGPSEGTSREAFRNRSRLIGVRSTAAPPVPAGGAGPYPRGARYAPVGTNAPFRQIRVSTSISAVVQRTTWSPFASPSR